MTVSEKSFQVFPFYKYREFTKLGGGGVFEG